MEHKGKIPCSVSMITLNASKGLPACLESLKDFAEIIIADGNSTDTTLEIARSAGVKVVKQYNTDESNLPCVMDKSHAREAAMRESTYPWRFFMDADDTLSPEAVEEIRQIVTDSNPKHFVWRMPTRIFIEGKEIKHEASYPSYQTRLVHESVGATFRGLVHERLRFDEQAFSVGTMRSYYNFEWSKERVAQYWKYLKTYADRELSVMDMQGFRSYLRWGFWYRLRTTLGYILWRIPGMYLRHGFRDSMPLWIELTIVRYHLRLLVGAFTKYVRTRVWVTLLVETLRGKDLNRILSNLAIRQWEGYGRVLDIGGREGRSSYWRYLKSYRWKKITTADIDASSHPDVVIDLEEKEFPFPDGYFDTALLFNVLEHLDKREEVLGRIARVLAPDGVLLGVVPFLVAVHPDPHDFVRLTDEGLEAVLRGAGFNTIEVTPVGRGPIAASYYQSEFLWPRVVKLLLIPLVLLLDALILRYRPDWQKKFPLSYTFRASVAADIH